MSKTKRIGVNAIRRMINEEIGQQIPGGLAAGKSKRDFDAQQLKIGTRVESEHTPDRDVAREIAMDHLEEDPDYYKKLAKMECVVLESVGGSVVDNLRASLARSSRDLKNAWDDSRDLHILPRGRSIRMAIERAIEAVNEARDLLKK